MEEWTCSAWAAVAPVVNCVLSKDFEMWWLFARIQQEAAVTLDGQCHCVCLVRLRKVTKTLRQYSW